MMYCQNGNGTVLSFCFPSSSNIVLICKGTEGDSELDSPNVGTKFPVTCHQMLWFLNPKRLNPKVAYKLMIASFSNLTTS